jgi:hypothetical protein
LPQPHGQRVEDLLRYAVEQHRVRLIQMLALARASRRTKGRSSGARDSRWAALQATLPDFEPADG